MPAPPAGADGQALWAIVIIANALDIENMHTKKLNGWCPLRILRTSTGSS